MKNNNYSVTHNVTRTLFFVTLFLHSGQEWLRQNVFQKEQLNNCSALFSLFSWYNGSVGRPQISGKPKNLAMCQTGERAAARLLFLILLKMEK